MPSKPSGNKPLTPKQELFVQEILKGKSQREAYRIAYPNCKSNDKTIDETASKLFATHKVHTRYKELHDRLMERATQDAIMSAEEVLKELSILGRAKIDDYLKVDDTEYVVGASEDGTPIKQSVRTVEIFRTEDIDKDKIKAISEIRQTKDGIALKLNDKQKALETLGRHWGLFTDKIDVKGEMSITIEGEVKEWAK
jgi:phage terminase small subunit